MRTSGPPLLPPSALPCIHHPHASDNTHWSHAVEGPVARTKSTHFFTHHKTTAVGMPQLQERRVGMVAAEAKALHSLTTPKRTPSFTLHDESTAAELYSPNTAQQETRSDLQFRLHRVDELEQQRPEQPSSDSAALGRPHATSHRRRSQRQGGRPPSPVDSDLRLVQRDPSVRQSIRLAIGGTPRGALLAVPIDR